jgi:hypothetical protein
MNKWFLGVIAGLFLAITSISAQQAACLPPSATDFQGSIYLNYGFANNSFSTQYRVSGTVGQPLVETALSATNITITGFWSQFLVPPLPPSLTASQGDYLDRIQLNWKPNPLGAAATGGYKLFRDGIYQALLDANTYNYNDYNVIAGKAYRYSIKGVNDYGDGCISEAIGFQVPNGTVTGWISTPNSNPVNDVLVSLMPLQGFSLVLDKDPATNTFGAAVAVDTVAGKKFFPVIGAQDYTVTFWMKSRGNSTGALMEFDGYPLQVTGYGDGFQVYLNNVEASPKVVFEAGTETIWHNVAISHSGQIIRVYVDGMLKTLNRVGIPTAPSTRLFLGSKDMDTTGWRGNLDELRIYHRRLNEIDLREVIAGTGSSKTRDLKYYWKFDEQLGDKSFDIVNRVKLYFCGTHFSTATTSNGSRTDIPLVCTSGRTDSTGFYTIESANYGTGTTFQARPSKFFYMNWALQFAKAKKTYAALPDFSLTPKSTLEFWVYSDGPDLNPQTLLSKWWGSNRFSLKLIPNLQNSIISDIVIDINGGVGSGTKVGELMTGYTHLAFTIDSTSSSSRTIATYINGNLSSTNVFSNVSGNWSDSLTNWILGADRISTGAVDNATNFTNFYTGLIDEFVVYNSILDTISIKGHVYTPRDMQEAGLRVYFPLNEAEGGTLNNCGSLPLDFGMAYNYQWSNFSKFPKNTPHEFAPATRQVTLNPSVTSVDRIDYTDRSLLNVTGYIRFKNSDCFAAGVEVLVNGSRNNPPIFSDSTGKFSVDLEPGKTAILEPVYKDHNFTPKFWEVSKISTPIAGIVFLDNTTRKVSGQIAGGDCRKSILKFPPGQGQGTRCVVKVRSQNGCYERTDTLKNQDGKYSFTGLPALAKYTVAIVEHSDPVIKADFQTQGGREVNLSDRDTVINFIYFAPPEVQLVQGLDTFPGCNQIVLQSGSPVQIGVKLIERYQPTYVNGAITDEGICVLDTARFKFINIIAGEVVDTVLSRSEASKTLKYRFKTGVPSPTFPYTKLLQVIGTSKEGKDNSLVREAIVEGIVNRENTFASITPTIPTLILRDPPGDQSYAFIEKGEKICTETTYTFEGKDETTIKLETELAPDVNIVLAPLGIGFMETIDGKVGPTVEGSIVLGGGKEESTKMCTTLDKRISTSEDELVVGAQGGDVYVGTAINMIFGFADIIKFDSCKVKTQRIINTKPSGATNYYYSEWYLKYYMIPYLKDLTDFYTRKYNENSIDTSWTKTYQDSIDLVKNSYESWESFIQKNNDIKAQNKGFIENISFDGGVKYEYSVTMDTAKENASSFIVGGSVGIGFKTGFEFKGIGFTLNIDSKATFESSYGSGTATEKSRKVGYVLGDNDIGDAFTVDVAWDPLYKTPTFITKSGQSSCPWEPETAHRFGAKLSFRDGSTPNVINVPSNEAATFLFNLTNVSQTAETQTYAFVAGPESNGKGAVIKLNGGILDQPIMYAIPIDNTNNVDTSTVIPITLTIERGPLEYKYDSVEVVLYTLCEDKRANDLGILPDDDKIAYSAQYLSVEFIRPCSEVTINSPEQNYVILQAPDTKQQITVSDYNLTEPLFKLVRTQYRRKNGDGAWITLEERYNPNWVGFDALPNPKPPVLESGSFTQFIWQTAGQPDGNYEIRAVAECTGDASNKPGVSKIIDIRIDRQPPSIVSVEPADGVYQVGDEISFTFDKPINTSKFTPPFFNSFGKIDLFDSSIDQLIASKVTAYENKIYITPEIQNKFIENHLIRVELKNLEDLAGNKTGPNPLKWLNSIPEFYVNRNELAWLTDSVGMTKRVEYSKTVEAKIQNRGDYPVPFEILNYPTYVHVVPNTGTLAPNEIKEISFTVDSTLGFGYWKDSITLRTLSGVAPQLAFMGGDERIPLGVRVVCSPPAWDLDPAQFENSMNLVLKLNVQGSFSKDVEDMVGAFIGGQLRGRSNVQFVPQISTPNNKVYLAYLTVFGSTSDLSKPINLQVWDASSCLLYGTVLESYSFIPDVITGDANNPATATTNNLVLRPIPITPGWNWLSFNLAFPNPATTPALSSLKYPANDLIKSQTQFANYFGTSWVGTLTSLDNRKMYQYRADKADTLQLLGLVLSDTISIPVKTGWNWIGYLPNYSLQLNKALSKLKTDGLLQAGDLIKSRTGFAQYIISPVYTGWLGNLDYLMPPFGYALKLTKPGITSGKIVYPAQSLIGDNPVESRGIQVPYFWNVDPSQFESSSTLIGMLSANGTNVTGSEMELGAFVNNEVRGSAQALYIAPLDAYLFFLTYYANSNGELVQFKLFNGANGQVNPLNESVYFAADNHQGSVENPMAFTYNGLSNAYEVANNVFFEVRPNPFSQSTEIRFALTQASPVDVTVVDLNGRLVAHFAGSGQVGVNALEWQGMADNGTLLKPGVYFIKLKTETGTGIRKVMLQR